MQAVHYYEKELRKDDGVVIFPADAPVTNFDAYAFGQAVAVSVWGVGAGLISQEDAMDLIEQINEIARPGFDSWEAFGRSYVLGRAMHWSDGTINEKRANQAQEVAMAMAMAVKGNRGGPWGRLSWELPAQ